MEHQSPTLCPSSSISCRWVSATREARHALGARAASAQVPDYTAFKDDLRALTGFLDGPESNWYIRAAKRSHLPTTRAALCCLGHLPTTTTAASNEVMAAPMTTTAATMTAAPMTTVALKEGWHQREWRQRLASVPGPPALHEGATTRSSMIEMKQQ